MALAFRVFSDWLLFHRIFSPDHHNKGLTEDSPLVRPIVQPWSPWQHPGQLQPPSRFGLPNSTLILDTVTQRGPLPSTASKPDKIIGYPLHLGSIESLAIRYIQTSSTYFLLHRHFDNPRLPHHIQTPSPYACSHQDFDGIFNHRVKPQEYASHPPRSKIRCHPSIPASATKIGVVFPLVFSLILFCNVKDWLANDKGSVHQFTIGGRITPLCSNMAESKDRYFRGCDPTPRGPATPTVVKQRSCSETVRSSATLHRHPLSCKGSAHTVMWLRGSDPKTDSLAAVDILRTRWRPHLHG